MSLDDIIKKSDNEKKKGSNWISSKLSEGESMNITKFVGEEMSEGQYGQQVVLKFMDESNKEVKLGRPFPLSKESRRFVQEVVSLDGSGVFTIQKKKDDRGYPAYYAKPIELKKAPKEEVSTDDIPF